MTAARAAMLGALLFFVLLVWDAGLRPDPLIRASYGAAEAGAAPAEEILFRALGAFRVFAVDALWIRMSGHMSEGRDGLVLADARTLLRLEPRCDEIRDFLHWHLAFNLAHRAVTRDARIAWIEEGLDIVEEGLRADPESAVLNRGLGTTFFMITDREDEYAEICLRRYGRRPVELAHEYLQRAFTRAGDARTLAFLLQALENAANFEMDRGRFGEAEALWSHAAGLAEKDLAPVAGEAEAANLAAFYRDMADRCRRE
jgi:hypothetical protein